MTFPLWLMIGDIDTMQRMLNLENEQPPKAGVLNLEALSAVISPALMFYEDRAIQQYSSFLSDVPKPILKIDDPDFSPDYMYPNIELVSRKLRDALALESKDIQYFEIDASACGRSAQAQDYRMLHVVNAANPIDFPRSGGSLEPFTLPDGTKVQRWRLDAPQPNRVNPRLVFRENFVAPAPLFRVPGCSWTLATDELAERVMRAGIKDMRFMDMLSERAQHETVLKTL